MIPVDEAFLAINSLYEDNKITANALELLKNSILKQDERLFFIIHRYKNKRIDARQFISSIYEIIECEAELIYNEIFADCSLDDAKHLSKAERDEKKLNDSSYTYGEIDFKSFFQVLSKISRINNSSTKQRKTFYDLGIVIDLCHLLICNSISWSLLFYR